MTPRETRSGAAKASAARRSTAMTASARCAGARLDGEGAGGHWSIDAPQSTARGKRPRGLNRRTSKEGEMAGEDLPFRIDRRADRLRHADDDAAGERAPERAEPADDDRLEGVDQPRRSDGRIEIGARAEIERGDGHHDHGEPGRHGEDALRLGCPSAPRSRRRPRWHGRRGRARCGRSDWFRRDDDDDGRARRSAAA